MARALALSPYKEIALEALRDKEIGDTRNEYHLVVHCCKNNSTAQGLSIVEEIRTESLLKDTCILQQLIRARATLHLVRGKAG